jgi:bisanhydrobacterioruberin hydratase
LPGNPKRNIINYSSTILEHVPAQKINRQKIATIIALLFHGFGALGILTGIYRDFFISSTPLNLLLMFALLLWTHPRPWRFFPVFVFITVITGILLEWIGVNTGMLFGEYTYGKVLGFRWQGVPLLIGVNWFIMMYCCGITMHTVLRRLLASVKAINGEPPPTSLKAISVIADGAVLAVFFDWVMEPVAVKLGYWTWGDNGEIPLYNYLCWLLAAMGLLALFYWVPFSKSNKFAVHLLLIQLMFFLLLRTFYT